MASLRHDYRGQAPQKYGKPTITYPYGDTQFPRIVEVRTAKKGTDGAVLLPFLTPHRDQKSFPGALLIGQTADCGDDTDKNISETYEVLPGPIYYDIEPDAQLGIPVMTTTQRRAATDRWACGEVAPIAYTVTAVTVGSPTVITLEDFPDVPEIFAEEWLVITGSNGVTPSLNGTWQVLGVNGNEITLGVEVTSITGSPSATAKRYSNYTVERRKTDNQCVVEMVTTRAVTNDITQYNQSTFATRPYPFPDALIAINEYLDEGNTTNITDPLNYSYSWSGGVGFQILPGFRGPCNATRLWVFSMGPFSSYPTNPATSQPYTPTVVIPAVGTVTVKGGARSQTFSVSGSLNITESTSNTFKGVTIPPVLTKGYTGPTVAGSGQATFTIDLPSSIVKDAGSAARTGWEQGDIITDIEQPTKLRGIGVYMTTIWLIVAPYTTGVGPS